ncbi:beta-glucosidase 43-like [Canna indica]|uniref:Beta-glucosidase 43-like n=1 Tax=Canna indica TaxID=4628 RepID=A0AAQ3QC74_9LILI|nr:beta-glucosidase 43-like [Canna indica]
MIPNNATADITVDEYHHYKMEPEKLTGKVLLHMQISIIMIFHWHKDEYLGWLSPKVVDAFADYADFCFERFGDRVKNWFTMNEPRVIADCGYNSGYHALGRCTSCKFGENSSTEPYIVAHNLILSHAVAVKRYREKYQVEQKGKIGIILDFNWYEPYTYIVKDKDTTQRARDDERNGVPIGPKIYISELKRAMDDGANVIGYFAWSILDNFEWRLGCTSRFGMVYVDYNTLVRYPKKSAQWLKKILKRKNN